MTRPANSVLSNGEFLDFERESDRLNTHLIRGLNRVRLAFSPLATLGIAMLNIFLAFPLKSSTILAGGKEGKTD